MNCRVAEMLKHTILIDPIVVTVVTVCIKKLENYSYWLMLSLKNVNLCAIQTQANEVTTELLGTSTLNSSY